MRQTDKAWKFSECYRGVGMQTARTTSMLLLIFAPIDVIRSKTDWLGRWGVGGAGLITMGICGGSYSLIWYVRRLRALCFDARGLRAPTQSSSCLALPGPVVLLLASPKPPNPCSRPPLAPCGRPLETLKNMGQAAIPSAGASVGERVAHLGGFKGLYRGAAPGVVSGGFRNGMAMIAMSKWQQVATQMGLRN